MSKDMGNTFLYKVRVAPPLPQAVAAPQRELSYSLDGK